MNNLQSLKTEQEKCLAIASDTSASVSAIRAANQRLTALKFEIAEAQIEEIEAQIEALNLSDLQGQIQAAQVELEQAWAAYDVAEQAKHQALGKLEQLQGRRVIRVDQVRQLQQRIAGIKATIAQTAVAV